MKPLNELFEVTYGNKLDLNKMRALSPSRGGVNFVGRSSANHGVAGTVAVLPDQAVYEAGLITVALGGQILSSFVQEHPFYTAQNVAVLRPLAPMTFAEKLYMCLCIRHNRFRYSPFGREANRTLRTLPVPEPSEFPDWVKHQTPAAIELFSKPLLSTPVSLPPLSQWRDFRLADLFDLRKGKRLTKAQMEPGAIPFVGAIDKNNGVSARVSSALHSGNTITVTYNGSVGEAFFQPIPFWASDDVNVLYPKFALTPDIAMFFITLLRAEKYRFNYGRKWHLDRMRETTLRLPVTLTGEPDYDLMARYIQSLPYSSQLLAA